MVAIFYELNIWVKARTSQMWQLCLNAEMWEVSQMRVILRLKSAKQVLVEVVRAEPLKQKTKYAWYLYQPKSSKNCTPDLYRG